MKRIKIKMTEKTETTVERLTVTTPEAAKMLGISERMLHQLSKDGKLPSVRIGRRVLYSIKHLQQYVDSFAQTLESEVPDNG